MVTPDVFLAASATDLYESCFNSHPKFEIKTTVLVSVYVAAGSAYSESVANLRAGQFSTYQPEIRPDATVPVSVGLSVVSISLVSYLLASSENIEKLRVYVCSSL